MVDKKTLMNCLQNVPDPELGISVVDLGLIYDVKVDKKGGAQVLMTLTTMGCPLFDLIKDPIETELKKIPQIKEVVVDLTFEPPWSTDMMSEEAKVKLGFF